MAVLHSVFLDKKNGNSACQKRSSLSDPYFFAHWPTFSHCELLGIRGDLHFFGLFL
jgi:hypothetical protein